MGTMTIQIMSGVVVVLVGAAVIGIVKSSMNGFILQLQKEFVSNDKCKLQHEGDAREREATRKNVQNHEDRLNALTGV